MAMVVSDVRASDQPIIFVNDAFVALTGYSRDEVLGRNCRFLQGPGTAPEDVARARQAIRRGEALSVDILNYRKNGQAFWNAMHLSPIRNDAGELTHYFGAQLDVSDKVRAQLAVVAAKHDLEAAVEARTRELQAALDQKSALLHEVDHRVKNNLQLIASLLMLQIRRTPEPDAREALRSTLDRVGAISTVHRRLFQEEVDRFDVGAFLCDLFEDRSGATGRERVSLPEDSATVAAGQAAALALLMNELLRFVQDGGPPEAVRLGLANGGDAVQVWIEGARAAGWNDSFGREIVDMLTRQLHGAVHLTEGDDGVRRAELRLPLDAGAPAAP
jgi:PAS domain S-box-containing protein